VSVLVRKNRRKKVEFTAKKMVPRKKKVSFVTTDGKRVNFSATEMVKKKEKVSFYAKNK